MNAKPNPMKLAVMGMTDAHAVEKPDTPTPIAGNANKRESNTPHAKNSRENKRHIGGFFDPLVSKQLRILAAESDRSIQSLLQEALNDLFNKHGKSSVA